MFGAILKATKISFQKGMTFCHSVYVKKVMKLLAFIFEQPSYSRNYSSIRSVPLFIAKNWGRLDLAILEYAEYARTPI